MKEAAFAVSGLDRVLLRKRETKFLVIAGGVNAVRFIFLPKNYSAQDLMNPKWRGKIVTDDPTIQSGNGGRGQKCVVSGPLSFVRTYLEGDVDKSFHLKALAAPTLAGYRFTMAAEEEHIATSRSQALGVVNCPRLVGSDRAAGESS